MSSEITGNSAKIMPRCESYQMGLTVTPIKESGKHPMNVECQNNEYMIEHLKFDELTKGKLTYPVSESTIDVGYINLKDDGEGPFIIQFSLQYDPRVLGVIGVSLSQYDEETSNFRQSSLWRTPQDGLTQVMAVVEGGVYAIGIQTLTNTEQMFIDGLGNNLGKSIGGKAMHESCLELSYSYLVASTMKGDSRVIQGGAMDLMALLTGDGLTKIA